MVLCVKRSKQTGAPCRQAAARNVRKSYRTRSVCSQAKEKQGKTTNPFLARNLRLFPARLPPGGLSLLLGEGEMRISTFLVSTALIGGLFVTLSTSAGAQDQQLPGTSALTPI